MVVSNVPQQRDLRDDLNVNRRRRRNKGAPRGLKDGESKDERQQPAIERPLPGPRAKGKQEQGQQRPKPQRGKKGRNTRDFEPSHAPPGLKVVVGDASKETLGKTLHGRAVVYVPNFFCQEEDASVYEKLMQEVKAAGSPDMWCPGTRTRILSPTTGIVTASGSRSRPSSWLSWIAYPNISRWT